MPANDNYGRPRRCQEAERLWLAEDVRDMSGACQAMILVVSLTGVLV